jgi:heat shock protein HslJ
MKIAHIISGIILLLLVSCGTVITGDSNESLKNQWVLQDNNQNQLGLNEEPITISFGLEEANKITGFAGCNYYGGNFSFNENEISFSDIYSTKRACPDLDIETEFFNLLNEVDNYEIKGNNLYLYKGKLLYLHFKK